MDSTAEHRVELEQFSGPLDLLLHLLREDELSVETIEVSRICTRYLEHLDDLDRIDIDQAGDFLVMASILMRLKSRSLLPEDESAMEEEDLDPRFELIRQLVEYRRFKQAAVTLDERREEAARRFPRGMQPELLGDRPRPPTVELGGADIDVLFKAFARLLRETEAASDYVVTQDDTPMGVHIDRIRALLPPPGERIRFRQLFRRDRPRSYAIGVFLALLELMKLGALDVVQTEAFGEIFVEAVEESSATAPPVPAGETDEVGSADV